MSFDQILFYVFATVLVLAAGAVVTVRNPVYSALYLVLCFVTSAAIWMLLEAEFLAIVLVLVYVGAVMVLFLFVVMMLDINFAPMREGFTRYLPVGILVAAIMAIEMGLIVGAERFRAEQMPIPGPNELGHSNTKVVGELMFTEYYYPFELAAILLLVAIVAAIALTMRKRPETRFQEPSRQVQVRKEDRLRIVNVPSESAKEDSA
ncbi:MAG: NADH-quinone oxidoreductase subunit J [Pseudomonadota bacterium]